MEKKTPSAFRKVFNLLGKNKASFATALLLCSATEPLYQIGFTFSYKYIVNGIEFKNVSMLINSATALIAIVVVYNICLLYTSTVWEGYGRTSWQMQDTEVKRIMRIWKKLILEVM